MATNDEASNPRFWKRLALAFLGILVAVLVYYNRPARLSFRKVADPDPILVEIRQLRELITIRYSIQKVQGIREDKDPVGSESILLIVQAQVFGGVDLEKIRSGDIRMDRQRKVLIKLPPAQILHINVDEKNTQVWDRSKTWWTPWIPNDNDLEKKARLAAIDSIRQQALEMGIILEAQVNAQNLIRALLLPMGIEQVGFEANQS